MRLLLIPALLVAGCAMTPQDMAQQSNYDVCRFSMGGPHSRAADYEIQRRGLRCDYGSIAAQESARSAAMMGLSRQLLTPAAPLPAPVTCDTVRLGNRLETTCR